MSNNDKHTRFGAGLQRRFTDTTVELRELDQSQADAKKPCLCGYAAKYNTITVLYSGSNYEYREVIMPGFFDDVLTDDVRCLFNHSSHRITGRTTANTLALRSDETGLYFENEPDTEISYVSDLLRSVKRKEVTQCSFAFTTKEQKWEELQQGERWIYTRYLIKAKKLYDVGPVTFPAYEDTEVDVEEKSLDALRTDFEQWRKAHTTEETTDPTPKPNDQQLKQRQRKLYLLERKL